jgi:hypothetical protein
MMQPTKEQQRKLAILAQSLYLANLLLLPGLSFCALLYYFFKKIPDYGFARIHLYRAVQLGIISGIILVLIPLLVLTFSREFEVSLMMMLLYFVTAHALLVLLGMFNLARAMSSRLTIF